MTNAVCSLNCTTLPEMLAKEQSLDLYKKDSSGSVGLLWLKRSFQFLVSLLWFLSISTDDDCMKSIVSQAYDESLRHYHNRFMRQTFRVSYHSLSVAFLYLIDGNDRFILLRTAKHRFN